jgi:hypothetical protein
MILFLDNQEILSSSKVKVLSSDSCKRVQVYFHATDYDILLLIGI